MTTPSTNSIVFMSYCWTTPDHEQWVLDLAERLMGDGVDVLLDKWELKEGQDTYVYMEKMVTDPNVSKVLAICDKMYAEKADGRKGGVGTETQIISKEVYSKVDQEKFIPIIAERDEKGEAYLPTFFKSRMYIDFSSLEKMNENYEQLLRVIFEQPFYKKPALGKPPSYIFESTRPSSPTQSKLQLLKDAVQKDKQRLVKGLVADYLSLYLEALEGYRIDAETEGEPLDEKIVSSIKNYLPYRDEFIDFLEFVLRYVNDGEIYESLFEFYEGLIKYKYKPADIRAWNEYWFDNFRFMIQELFLYLITILIKNKKYKEASMFLERPYFHESDNYGTLLIASSHGAAFNTYLGSLEEYRKQRLKLNRISITADLLKEGAYHKGIGFDAIMQTELILSLRGILHPAVYGGWHPKTLVYAERYGAFPLFAKATSGRHFQNVKTLLGIKNKEELVEKYETAAKLGGTGFSRGFGRFSYDDFMNLEKLDTLP